MKNSLILHGTDATTKDHWFGWLKDELEADGFKVWVPDLPQANKQNSKRYNDFLLAQKDFVIDDETIMIGHSSGAVAILGLLQELPDDVTIKKAILVGAFHNNDLGWESLEELFEKPFDFASIKQHAKQITFIHSDNDPYIPLEQAEYLAEKLDGELIILEGQGHFNTGSDPKFTKFPYLLDVIRD
ncbi:MAG: alpha/beta hydrolase [Candidatus Levybacteria bacterium]|nr:alpha/beta hydrolase [Candidatus Levybacteria bacterium]